MLLITSLWQRDASRCTLWFRVHCVLFVLGIIFTVLAILSSQEKLVLIVLGVGGLLYQAYSLWVVWAYVKQLTSRRASLQKGASVDEIGRAHV